MASRQVRLTRKTVEKRLAKGIGKGQGAAYKPILTVLDLSSKGVSTRTHGMKMHRQHDLLSNLELCYLLLCEWADNVVDVREQFLLELDSTTKIAQELGVKHPTVNGEVTAMQTDFFLTMQDSLNTAVSVKYAADLGDERVLEKLQIEEVYWRQLGVTWTLFTEEEVPKGLVENIFWVRKPFELEGYQIDGRIYRQIAEVLSERLIAQNQPLVEITSWIDDHVGVKGGTTMTVVRHLIAIKKLRVNMADPIDVDKVLEVTSCELGTGKEDQRNA